VITNNSYHPASDKVRGFLRLALITDGNVSVEFLTCKILLWARIMKN